MLWSTYKDHYLRYLTLRGCPRYVQNVKSVLERFTRYCDPYLLEDVSSVMYASYLARRKSDTSRDGTTRLSPATINGDIRCLNSCFAAALRPDDLHPDRLGVAPPDWRAPRQRRLREPLRRPHALTTEGLDRVFAACDSARRPTTQGTPPVWWRAFFLVAYTTGIRCGALLAVPRPSDSELAEHRLTLPAELDKGGRERQYHLHPLAVEAIKGLPPARDGRLFQWDQCRRHFYRTLHRFQTRAGLPREQHGLPHDLRRTKGTMLVRAGCSLAVVQRELGHSSPTITERYYLGDLSAAQIAAVNALPLPASLLAAPPASECGYVFDSQG